MSKDQAARIAEKEYPVDKWSSAEERGYAMSMRPTLEKRIRRAIRTAVRKERERCVACVDDCKMVGSYAMISLIKAINGGKR